MIDGPLRRRDSGLPPDAGVRHSLLPDIARVADALNQAPRRSARRGQSAAAQRRAGMSPKEGAPQLTCDSVLVEEFRMNHSPVADR